MIETTAYLLVAEAIANARRHAHATECTLRAADGGDRLTVEVRDNGIGGADGARRAAGWSASPTARRRSAGAFALDSPRGGGTDVRLEIPVDR